MSRRIRLFLLCLIALALPLQGIAAATLSSCDHRAPMTHGAAHDHAAMPAHAHAHAAVEKSGCSACAACCVGLAIASTLPDIPVPLLPPATLHAVDDPRRTGTPPAVLERPPRRSA